MTGESLRVRTADETEIDHLAKLWFDGWRDAHQLIVPAELTRRRTLASFRDRMSAGIADVRAIGAPGAATGFAMLKGDELYQLYLSAEWRGRGAAVALIDDAEARLAARGVAVAWLACAIGNDRAARFYEKRGWGRAGTIVNELETTNGSFPLEVWRYEKQLGPLHLYD